VKQVFFVLPALLGGLALFVGFEFEYDEVFWASYEEVVFFVGVLFRFLVGNSKPVLVLHVKVDVFSVGRFGFCLLHPGILVDGFKVSEGAEGELADKDVSVVGDSLFGVEVDGPTSDHDDFVFEESVEEVEVF
jgi:hypothetical protein